MVQREVERRSLVGGAMNGQCHLHAVIEHAADVSMNRRIPAFAGLRVDDACAAVIAGEHHAAGFDSDGEFGGIGHVSHARNVSALRTNVENYFLHCGIIFAS